MPIWLIIAAVAGYAIYRTAHQTATKAGSVPTAAGGTGGAAKAQQYKIIADDQTNGLSAGDLVTYTGDSQAMLNAMASNLSVPITTASGASVMEPAGNLSPV